MDVHSSPSGSQSNVHRICLTPTRNESWIIDRFLAAAKIWASHVIVADQCSTDGTRERLRATSEVKLILNDSPVFDEQQRQHLLLTRAREISGKRILFGLDADEALSANCVGSSDWERIENAAPGTVLRLRWVNILPGFTTAWIPPERTAFGFVDDGSEHRGRQIHSPRVPRPPHAPVLDLDDIVVLHFQYVLWERMASKQRWYQAWEHLHHREKSPLEIYRQYHHMHGSWEPNEIQPIRDEWLLGYDNAGIDFRKLQSEIVTWWDREVINMLIEHGPAYFRKIALWEKDWNDLSRRVSPVARDLSDPRSLFERFVHCMLAVTQPRRSSWVARGFERMLRVLGW